MTEIDGCVCAFSGINQGKSQSQDTFMFAISNCVAVFVVTVVKT